MRIATLAVMSDDGHQVWSGSALEFVRANGLDRFEVIEMVAVLRGVPGSPPEPFIGGGAAALSYVHLVENIDLPPVEYCPHCDAANFAEYIRCRACAATADESDEHCAHEWAYSDTDRCYCLQCGADGDA